ncbi:unnamed protein product [Mytilus coruscus]|uniref:C2H2-type domain-containing protein n=1 Tax=Mytilus coruscus TaxID=42192 RepID=A0A6J8CB28_MYTCO|nr:unnamed protein product [Mytilus coruscus]
MYIALVTCSNVAFYKTHDLYVADLYSVSTDRETNVLSFKIVTNGRTDIAIVSISELSVGSNGKDKNNDEICCARALVTAKANIVKHPKSEDIRKGRLIQKQLAIELHDKANIPLKTCNLEDITQFQRAMNAYQIHVVSQQHFNGIIFQGPEAERKIYLYHHNEHYDVITSMPGFSNRSYYCNICQKGYQNKEEHKCNNICTSCHKINEIENKEWIYCKDCNRFFQGDVCIQLHAKKTSQ